MEIINKKIDELIPADYNPRIELKPEMQEWQELEKSLSKYGLVSPIVWNKRTGNVVGGHQRLSVLKAQGITEVEVSAVDIDEEEEKLLNVALNKIEGDWDNDKLKDLIQELSETGEIIGFSEMEINKISDELSNAIDEDFVLSERKNAPQFYRLQIVFKKEDEEQFKDFIRENTKDPLLDEILRVVTEG